MIEAVVSGVSPAELVDDIVEGTAEAKQKLTGWVKKALTGKDFTAQGDYDTPDKARRAIAAGLFKKIGAYHQK
jgi:hypothetical protein